jgi:hypothetical protein
LRIPSAAAIAGVAFSLPTLTSFGLLRSAIPADPQASGGRLAADTTEVALALSLIPFAGIAFLWFIGVVRDGFGQFEDKFFSTVFIGSGLLFLAMMFVTMAVGAGLEATNHLIVDQAAHSEVATFGQMVLLSVSKTYALRMAAVFMISLATIWLRTGLMPRWLVGVTYLVALGLIVASDVTMWLALAFPLWVIFVSVLLLVRSGVIDIDRDT